MQPYVLWKEILSNLISGHAVKQSSVRFEPKMLGYFLSKMLSNFKPVCYDSLIKFLR